MSFFKSQTCTSGKCCYLCRDREGGRTYRRGWLQAFGDQNTPVDFACPYGLAYADGEPAGELVEPRDANQSDRPRVNGDAPCVHLGAPTGETVECKSCKGVVKLKVFACAARGECFIGRSADARASCKTCAEYRP